jgi:hypothetical protein
MDEKLHGAVTQTSPAMAPKLEVVQGENIGELFKVKLTTTIGRELDNDIVLLDPRVSRYHAQILLEQGQWTLKDLGSANGTQVNGAVVTVPTPLQADDRIGFGETILAFKLPAQSQAETAPVQPVATPTVSPGPPAYTPPAFGQAQPLTRPPRLALIAGGFMLLLCFAALFLVYYALSRSNTTAPGSIAANSTPSGPDDGNNQPAATQLADPPRELVLVYEDDFSDSFGG